MKMRRYLATVALVFLSLGFLGAATPDKVVKKIIETGTTDNRTMQHEDFLANRIGGRIVGSHALEDAEMAKWDRLIALRDDVNGVLFHENSESTNSRRLKS